MTPPHMPETRNNPQNGRTRPANDDRPAQVVDARLLDIAQRLHLFETLVEQTPTGMVITDLTGRFTYANQSIRDTYGYGDATIGMTIADLVAPFAQVEIEPRMVELFTNGSMAFESYMITKAGDLRTVFVQALLIFADNGAPMATAAMIRDQTEDHAREQELRLTKFSLDRSSDSVHWIDPSRSIVYANDGACNMLGYDRDELLGLKITDIDPIFPMENWEAVWGQLRQQGIMTFESRHRCKDGRMVPVDIVANYVEFEGREYGCVIARDITEQQQRAEELRTFKAMVENTPEAIAIADMTGTFVYTNQAYQAMLGYERDLAGMNTLSVILPEDRPLVSNALANLRTERTGHVQARYVRRDGSIFPVAATVFLQEAPDGTQQVIGFTRDMTAQQRAEAERAEFQQQIIVAQQAALRELSTPLIPIADGVVAMPLIGSIDSARAQMVIETLLNGVADLRAHTTIIDITGVPVVDTEVANALLRAAQAIKLLGARVILTGIRPEVAQTLVGLGVDMGGIITRGTLQSGIAEALASVASVTQNKWR